MLHYFQFEIVFQELTSHQPFFTPKERKKEIKNGIYKYSKCTRTRSERNKWECRHYCAHLLAKSRDSSLHLSSDALPFVKLCRHSLLIPSFSFSLSKEKEHLHRGWAPSHHILFLFLFLSSSIFFISAFRDIRVPLLNPSHLLQIPNPNSYTL